MNRQLSFLRRFVWIFSVLFTLSPSAFSQPGDSRDYTHREGQEILYHWIHYTTDGRDIPFDLSLHLGPDFNRMKQVYRGCNHQHGRYRQNVLEDPFFDVVKVVADALTWKAKLAGISPVELALSFTQSLPYRDDMNDYQSQASEVLLFYGDCSDHAVLYASLMYNMHIDCIFLLYPIHLMTAIWCTGNMPSGSRYFIHRGKRYFMAEQTGGNSHIGDCWGDYCSIPAQIIDLY